MNHSPTEPRDAASTCDQVQVGLPNPADRAPPQRRTRFLLGAARSAVAFAFVGCTGKNGYYGPEYEDGNDDTMELETNLGDTTQLPNDASGTTAP